MNVENGKFMSSVKVGPKGQIVIPKEVRQMFEIKPGDTLIILADTQKGIAIEKYSTFSQIADAIFAGRSKELYPEHTQEESIEFAKYIKDMKEEDINE
ncbi:MAG: AbrB/MazE/SpoVT family DNA-binding domain-containing protein [Clostridiaceae bacterium]|nr:AbrB/MazE/SpoVT family DNA-binding domain-containing protein [Clostridiaceae bacterium]